MNLREESSTISPEAMREIVTDRAAKYGVPREVMLGIGAQESGWDNTAVGKSGEFGYLQIMPETARKLGLHVTGGDDDERWHPVAAADAAARLLKDAHDKSGSWDYAVRAYNTGKGHPTPKGDEYISNVFQKAQQEMEEIKAAEEFKKLVMTKDPSPATPSTQVYNAPEMTEGEAVNANLGLPLSMPDPNIASKLNMIAPVSGKITSVVGDPRDGGARQHAGADIASPAGTEVVAPVTMQLIAHGTGGTNLRDGDGWAWFRDPKTLVEYHFAHIAPISGMQVGDVVQRGQPWTTVGNVISGTHLHLSVKDNDGSVIDWTKSLGLPKGGSVDVGMEISKIASAIYGPTAWNNWGSTIWNGLDKMTRYIMNPEEYKQDWGKTSGMIQELGDDALGRNRNSIADIAHMGANAAFILENLFYAHSDGDMVNLNHDTLINSESMNKLKHLLLGWEQTLRGQPEPQLSPDFQQNARRFIEYGGLSYYQKAPEHRSGTIHALARAVGGLVPDIVGYAAFSELFAAIRLRPFISNVLGFAAHDALLAYDQGPGAWVKAAVHGGLMGVGLGVTSPLALYQHMAAMSLLGGVSAYMQTGDLDTAKEQAVVFGALGWAFSHGNKTAGEIIKQKYDSYTKAMDLAKKTAQVLQGPPKLNILDEPGKETLTLPRVTKGEISTSQVTNLEQGTKLLGAMIPNMGDRTAETGWEGARYSETGATSSLVQEFKERLDYLGIKMHITPFDGCRMSGARAIDSDGVSHIFINTSKSQKEQRITFEHEVFHERVARGDRIALALVAAVNLKSAVVKAWAKANPDYAKGDIAEEFAAEYATGLRKFKIGDKEYDANEAFNEGYDPERIHTSYKMWKPDMAPEALLKELTPDPEAEEPSDIQYMYAGISPKRVAQEVYGVGSKIMRAVGKVDEMTAKFRVVKDLWWGKRGTDNFAHWQEFYNLRNTVRKFANERFYGNNSKQLSLAILEWMDLRNNTAHLQQFWTLQPKDVRDAVQSWFSIINESPEIQTFIQHLDKLQQIVGKRAFDKGFVKELTDNYVARAYDWRMTPEEKEAHEAKVAAGMAAAPDITRSPGRGEANPRYARKFQTRFEARAMNFKYRINAVEENLMTWADECTNLMHDFDLMQENPHLFSTEQKVGWKLNLGKNFRKQEHVGNITPKGIMRAANMLNSEVQQTLEFVQKSPLGEEQLSGTVKEMANRLRWSLEAAKISDSLIDRYMDALLNPEMSPSGRAKVMNEIQIVAEGGHPEAAEGSVRYDNEGQLVKAKISPKRKDESRSMLEVDDKGNVWLSKPTYSPKAVADDLNKIFHDPTRESRIISGILKYNAAAKALKLSFGLFHAQAFMRNLLTSPDFFAVLHPIKYRDAGRQAIAEWNPILEGGLKAGLLMFQGTPPDWAEGSMEKLALGRALDHIPIAGKVNDYTWKALEQIVDWTFHGIGNGLMAKYYVDTYNWARKQPKYQSYTDHMVHKEVANYVNDVFGSRNHAILGTNPMIAAAQNGLLLARNWTLSNMKLFGNMFNDKPLTRQLAQRYWMNALGKTVGAAFVLNMITSFGDDKNQWERWCAIYESGARNWGHFLDVDLTPLYRVAKKFCHAAGIGDLPDEEYRMFFGIGGHFTDAIKMMFDTTKFFSDKASLLVNMVEGARTGQDWRNRSYTTIREWMGLTGDDTQDPLRFSLVKDEPSHGVISTSQIPSYALSQFGNLLPIPIDNLISHFQGELDGIQMFGKDLGGKFVLKKLYTPMVQGIHKALKSMTPLGTPQSREEAKAKRDLFDIIKIEHDPSKFYGKVWEKVNEGVINDTTAEHMIERGVNMAADPQWAELKYQLGEIAKNNFLQALQIVEKGSPLEQQVMKQVLYQHTESIKDPSKIGEYFKRMNQLGGKK